MMFVLFAGGMLLAALLLVLLPLKRRRGYLGLTGFALAGTLLVAAVLLYAGTGYWRVVLEIPPAEATTQDIDQMVETLAARLVREPADVPGWLMLGRSYMVLEQYDKAELAYGHALRQGGFENPDALAGYAEAMTLNNRGMTEAAAMMLERALQLDPANPKALWYGGIAAQQRGDYPLAMQRYQTLLAANPPDALREIIDKRLTDTQHALESGAQLAVAAGTDFSLSVRLDPALRARLPAGAVLFLYIRAAGQSGPPLAVKRLTPGNWPVETTLGQADVMLPDTDLAAHDHLLFGALLSRDGNVQREPGDLYGEIEVAGPVNGTISLTIDKLVP